MATARYRQDENDIDPDDDEPCDCGCHMDDNPKCCALCEEEGPYDRDVEEEEPYDRDV